MTKREDQPSDRLRLDMYPLPGALSNPPVWEDIEHLALNWPAAHDAVTMVQRGDWTREQALIALVYWLADGFSRMFKAEIERRMMEPPPPFVLPKNS